MSRAPSDAIGVGHGAAATLAAVTASLGWLALVLEGHRSISRNLARGVSLPESLFLYFHFFTILTNIAVAVLMSVTAIRLARRQALPAAGVYNATLAYILVTCVTYEVMLRQQWRPDGLQFVTDALLHDVVPALTLAFWLAFAPRAGTRWRDALWMLVYPIAYFAMTIIAGSLGEGYPYSFLDVDALGLGSVLVVAVIFQAIFYGLGLATTGLCKARSR